MSTWRRWNSAICSAKRRARSACWRPQPWKYPAWIPLCDAILPGSTGFIAAVAGAWEDALECLLDDADARSRMGRAARIHARALFGPEAYADLMHSPGNNR